MVVRGCNTKVEAKSLSSNSGPPETPCSVPSFNSNTILELRSLLPLHPCLFPRPLLCIHYFSILCSNMTLDSVLGTPYARPCPTFPIPCPLSHSVQHHTGTLIPCSPLTHVRFQDPYFISVTFLFSILTLTLDLVFRTPYA